MNFFQCILTCKCQVRKLQVMSAQMGYLKNKLPGASKQVYRSRKGFYEKLCVFHSYSSFYSIQHLKG